MHEILESFQDYELIASGGGEKLERWGRFILLRPDPQAIWEPAFDLRSYNNISAIYNRLDSKDGKWVKKQSFSDEFAITYKNLVFNLKLMNFKHTGLFPEQAINWEKMKKIVTQSDKKIKVLNLFAYTGGATVALAKQGAHVTHVDAAKAMVARAKQNCISSNVDEKNTRFIVEDCLSFVKREQRRGNKYNAIIMDPPKFGRGSNGELWKIEDDLFNLIKEISKIINYTDFKFFLLNSYTTGLQSTVMANMLNIIFETDQANGYDLLIKETTTKGVYLPCGSSAILTGGINAL